MSFYNSKPKIDFAKALASLKKKNPNIQPVIVGRKLAKSWWAMAWNSNLECYADFSNRISRGRSYVKSGGILDLDISLGSVSALVQGSRRAPYRVQITIDAINDEKWNAILKTCGHSIENLEALSMGKFPETMMELFAKKGEGLFPSPKEIRFQCSCPDWAYMCKHVAAVLYGIGVRLDENPLLFFTLRNIDFEKLIKKTVQEKVQTMLKNIEHSKPTPRTLTNIDTKSLFGI